MAEPHPQHARLAAMVEKVCEDPSMRRRLTESVSDRGRAFDDIAEMSDDELLEVVELELRHLRSK